MLEIGWTEMLVIAIVMIVIVGPKDLPKMLRTFGNMTSKMRAMAGDFRKQFDEAMKEAELDDLKSLADDARKLNPAGELKKAFNPMEKAAQDVRAGLDAMNAKKPAKAEPTPAVAKANEPLKAGATAVAGEGKADAPAASPAKAANGASPAGPAAAAKAKPAAAKATTVKATAAKPAAKAVPAKPASKPKADKSRNGGAAT